MIYPQRVRKLLLTSRVMEILESLLPYQFFFQDGTSTTTEDRRHLRQGALEENVQTRPNFISLPKELRDMIWSECISDQIIILSCSTVFNRSLLRHHRPAVISQVCHEVREVALRSGSLITLENGQSISGMRPD